MLEIINFIAVYLITVTIAAIMTYRELKFRPRTLGDLLSYISDPYLIPILNTLLLLVHVLILLFCGILKITGIVWLWNKLMNIRL